MKRAVVAAIFAVLAAAFYALSTPLTKLLLADVGPATLAGLLYLGAGLGMGIVYVLRRRSGGIAKSDLLRKSDLPFTVAMVVLDILAPILLMLGVERTAASNVSLLNNFEIVATALIALVFFGESVSGRLWVAIALVTASSILLTFDGGELSADPGSLLVLGACICWGIENNCTRRISERSSEQIVTVKGLCSGLGGLVVAAEVGEVPPEAAIIVAAMVLGFVAYGLSINFYVKAQRDLGAARTSAFYSLAPFIGVGFSFAILGEAPGPTFYLALAGMAVATALMAWDSLTPNCGRTSERISKLQQS
ncbi:MAG: DMT family transporter [Coriobacteriales bacterium]|jgi:drug/metabolite transporter (DMT)-like permease